MMSFWNNENILELHSGGDYIMQNIANVLTATRLYTKMVKWLKQK